MDFTIKQINDERTLKKVLDMCYSILGEHYEGLYSREAWTRRLDRGFLMLYAELGGEPIAAVLGRAESPDSAVIGFAACVEKYRGKGVTKSLMSSFERSARLHDYLKITLTSFNNAWGFYEKCGYEVVGEKFGKRVYCKYLG
ncbi:MAG: GNAT family N-acetyltransferase [Lachnospiraceae bacterium]|nr:GNAT family N-acetyltransferase [Ruminococcus sp.]MCM1274607.1 GNAT family N-acetyltransferase [Lachnospiraceae bacterium]